MKFLQPSPNAFFGVAVIVFIKFEANEPAARVDTGNSRGSRAHAVVQHHITWVGVSADEIFIQSNWLLRWMENAAFGSNAKHGTRVPTAVVLSNIRPDDSP